MPDLLSARDLDRSTIDGLLTAAGQLQDGGETEALRGKVVALAFFAPSLRTRVGFEVAAARSGASTTIVSQPKFSDEMTLPESLEDTVQILAAYCDAICLRHTDIGAPQTVAGLIDTPVINCGNGNREHPTQALIDLFVVQRLLGGVDGLRIALVGDLRHMRSTHSLIVMLSRYERVCVRCISPVEQRMPAEFTASFEDVGTTRSLHETTDLVLDDVDVVYFAGFPPRTAAGTVAAEVRSRYAIDRERAERLQPHARILCPLPRIDEIARDVDALPAAAYFKQSALGTAMRTAVLEYALRASG